MDGVGGGGLLVERGGWDGGRVGALPLSHGDGQGRMGLDRFGRGIEGGGGEQLGIDAISSRERKVTGIKEGELKES